MTSIVGDAWGASFTEEAIVSGDHRAHGVTLLVGLEADVTVRSIGGGVARGQVVCVPPDVVHRYAAAGPVVGMLLDSDVHVGASAMARVSERPRCLDDELSRRIADVVRSHRATLERPSVLAGVTGETAHVLREHPARRRDRRVVATLERLRDRSIHHVDLVAASGLGEAHLQALFRRDVGIAMRTYRLWHRMLEAVLALRDVDATRAAHAAGFADLAHFSRTCVRMMGHAPSVMRSALLRGSGGP